VGGLAVAPFESDSDANKAVRLFLNKRCACTPGHFLDYLSQVLQDNLEDEPANAARTLAWSEEVQALAREITGKNANADIQDLAHRIAEAHIDLLRIRQARHRLLSRALSDPYYDSQANLLGKAAFLRALLGRKPPDVPMEVVVKFVTSTPEGPHKFGTILAQEATQLLAMDRYERRALSRRKSAVRAFDEARRRFEPLPESSF
jgi:hypothetical protein